MTTRFHPFAYAVHLKRSGKYAVADGLIWEWNEVHWRPLDGFESGRKALDWISANQNEFASAKSASAAVATALLHLPLLPQSTRYLAIPCQNGYILVENGSIQIVPPTRDLGITYAINCQCNPEAPPPSVFLRFLNRVLPDADVRARVQEFAGYTLTSDTRYQRAQLWLGKGANGKGVLANIIQELHGKVASPNLADLDGFKLSGLIGASLIYVDEAPIGAIDEHKIKSLIAGEPVFIDRKYAAPITARLLGKWLVLGNQMPKIKDHSDGFWRRWDIVPFDVQIPESERDAQLAHTIITTELSGVLNWALEGLLRLEARGRFNPVLPASMTQMLGTAKTATSSILAWIEDSCVAQADGARITRKDDIYAHYNRWAKANGLVPVGGPKFWGEMKGIFDIEDCRRRLGGPAPVRCCNLAVPEIPGFEC